MPKYRVIGKCEGMTGYRGQFYFKNGICTIPDDDSDESALHRRIAARLLPRDYAAYPIEIAEEMHQRWLQKENSRKAARRAQSNGIDNVHAQGAEGGVSPPVRSDIRQAWDDVAKESEPVDGGATATAEQGSSGPAAADATSESAIRLKAVEAAARGLSWQDDAHWTASGRPRLDHLSADAGFSVTFDDVQAVLPGFDRNMAQQLAGG